MGIKNLFDGVYSIDGKIATLNFVKGRKVYGEELVSVDHLEYRLWNPYRSKLAAAILNGLNELHIGKGSSVLYLGAATGTTASHISDIIGASGKLYAVEFSERNMRNLLELCETRKNMLPILSDARDVDNYSEMIGRCDVIYQDLSTREQAKILLKNSKLLKQNGYAYFIIKSQSIDISKKPKEVYEDELGITQSSFALSEKLNLEPYDSMHLFAVLKKL